MSSTDCAAIRVTLSKHYSREGYDELFAGLIDGTVREFRLLAYDTARHRLHDLRRRLGGTIECPHTLRATELAPGP
jgi:hypothetical protein